MRVRWWSCPFTLLASEVPTAGRVLEVGCGHGLLSLYLALSSSKRDVLGVDIDRDKIDVATAVARLVDPAEANVRFEVIEPHSFADGEFDAIVIADVLYLLHADARETLLDACVAHLAPHGVLVLKETDRVPRWKAMLTIAQELISTRVLRITEGDEVEFAPPEVFADRLRESGLAVNARRIDKGYLHPHHLIVAAKRG